MGTLIGSVVVCVLVIAFAVGGFIFGKRRNKPTGSSALQPKESDELKAARSEQAIQNELLGAVTIERNVANVKSQAMKRFEEAARSEQEALSAKLSAAGKEKKLLDNQVITEESRQALLAAQNRNNDLTIQTAKQQSVMRRIEQENKPKPWWDKWYVWVLASAFIFIILVKVGFIN
ncbi:hypothetical protein GF382_01415 [Candidatus Falkowbacteria bacterium]|nr:hypothetical protein [Candidatus Falkowbacteria bacterium]